MRSGPQNHKIMSTSIKAKTHQKQQQEKLASRIKTTKAFIVSNNLTGLLNNQKWFNLFEFIEDCNLSFQMKLLNSDEIIHIAQIFELEKTAILIDLKGNFVIFLEIEKISIPRSVDIHDFLSQKKFEFNPLENVIEIIGYRKNN
ncbi:MAG TPA: hypothetical protein P5514_01335 [Bacteroidales bacterium]|nr:hypothetical protein [Bacteroidales bacterium]HRX95559.1 hypothetical protein [Bacteroidales bacterium]